MHDRDVFQLAYLPHLIGGHFDAMTVLFEARDGATPELAQRVEPWLAALQRRGPEVVSCVWQVARVLAEHGTPPPAEPKSAADAAALLQTAASAGSRTPVFEHAARCGLAERTLDVALRLAWLWPAAPDHAKLTARVAAIRETLANLAANEPATECSTTQLEAASITVALQAAARAFAGPPRDALLTELGPLKARVAICARALEAAAWGTPRTAIRAWSEKRITGAEVLRRIAEHHRWSVPVRTLPGNDAAPRTLTQGETTAMFAFSDRTALAARPSALASDRPDEQQVLSIPGAYLLRSLPDDVDVIVLDALDDPTSGINYQRSQRPMLTQVCDEVAFELAACNWSQLDLDILRKRRFWVLVHASALQMPIAHDAYGRAMPAVYSTEQALDAHLEAALPAQREQFAAAQRLLLPGQQLFSTLVKGAGGFILNPKGPGRSRAFNRRTLEALAAEPAKT